MLIPNALVAIGTREATACFKSFEEPRGPELPWCGDSISWFSFPARVPWTVTPATYRGEELRIRIALGQYGNAVAGKPSRADREASALRMEEARTIVRTGSQRLAFEELGPAVGAPDLGQDALLAGDRDTLLRHAKEWGEWHQRLHALDAALLEGDPARALDIAKHYATFDPRDEDLRSALGAMLCLGGDTKRGIEMLLHQQNDRASRRYAAMSRNWGDVRTALLACASLARVTPPPRPATSEAGQDDGREARAPLRLRAMEDHDNRKREAQESAQQLLSNALPAGARAPILASLLASGWELPADTWAELARAHVEDGEPVLLDLGSVNIVSWMDVPPDRPIETGPVFRKAAERLLEIAKDADAVHRPLLEPAAGALFIEGARSFVRVLETDRAIEMLRLAAPLARMDAPTLALAEAIVRYATGDPEGAHAVLMRTPIDASSPELRAAVMTLRAEVSGKSGPPSREEATAAFEQAKKSGSAALIAWARRVRFWAAPDAEPPAPIRAAEMDPMAGRFSVWPSLGYANRLVAWTGADDARLAILEKNLGVWSAVRSASEADKRAFRYALLRHRGDAPDALVPYFAVAAEIAGEGGDPEVWLDAVMASDAPRYSMRVYTWTRAQVARARGDQKAHAQWMLRMTALAKMMSDADRMELARFLGI